MYVICKYFPHSEGCLFTLLLVLLRFLSFSQVLQADFSFLSTRRLLFSPQTFSLLTVALHCFLCLVQSCRGASSAWEGVAVSGSLLCISLFSRMVLAFPICLLFQRSKTTQALDCSSLFSLYSSHGNWQIPQWEAAVANATCVTLPPGMQPVKSCCLHYFSIPSDSSSFTFNLAFMVVLKQRGYSDTSYSIIASTSSHLST